MNKEKEAQLPLEKVYTPDSKTIEAVGNYLQVPAEKLIASYLKITTRIYIDIMIRFFIGTANQIHHLEEQTVEYKLRAEADSVLVSVDDIVEKTVAYIFS